MPEGSSNYPIWSQQILRAARAGRILQSQDVIRRMYSKRGPDDDKDADVEEEDETAAEEAKRGTKRNSQGFEVKRWAQLARAQEESNPEFLAKRREGLPSIHRIPIVDTATLRQVKVRRVDANSQPVIYEVLVAEGKVVDGEVTEVLAEDDALVVKPAAGTLITGLGVANEHGMIIYSEPPAPLFGRGRPAPAKRKGAMKKGPGRGRKKVDFERERAQKTAAAAEAKAAGIEQADTDVKMENTDGGAATPAPGEEDGEDGEDDEDEEEDGEVDADGEGDDDREEGELTPEPGGEDVSGALEEFKSPQKPAGDVTDVVEPTTTKDILQVDMPLAAEVVPVLPMEEVTTIAPAADIVEPELADSRESSYSPPPATVSQPFEQTSEPSIDGLTSITSTSEASRIPGLSLASPEAQTQSELPAAASIPEVGLLDSLSKHLDENVDLEDGEVQ
jgi:hypothetical protein